MEFRFQVVVGHVENPLMKRTLRRQIARLNTRITAAEKTQAIEALKAKA
jgi:large subunit ribosomal protein L29